MLKNKQLFSPWISSTPPLCVCVGVCVPRALPEVTRWTNVKQSPIQEWGCFHSRAEGYRKQREEIPSLAVVPPTPTPLISKASADLFKLEAAAPPWTLLNKGNGSLDGTANGNLFLNKHAQLALHHSWKHLINPLGTISLAYSKPTVSPQLFF